MGTKSTNSKTKSSSDIAPITEITVEGYKTIKQAQAIDIRPLTILAGANNSGKSSMMQPLLLLKQTSDAEYDPGPLKLDGDNVTFTSVEQLLSLTRSGRQRRAFSVEIKVGSELTVGLTFEKDKRKGFAIREMRVRGNSEDVVLRQDMGAQAIKTYVPDEIDELLARFVKSKRSKLRWDVVRRGAFLNLEVKERRGDAYIRLPVGFSPSALVVPRIEEIIHLPGLRGMPVRAYPKTAVGRTFKGAFPQYVASVIANWQDRKSSYLHDVFQDLEDLGLTWKVKAEPVDDVRVEIQVGRMPHRAKGIGHELVNVADVGLGVSQALPIVVALRLAKPHQIVYIEQPEIHLHPRSLLCLAQLLCAAARRGVRVVAETHSSLLLLAIQTVVAKGKPLTSGDVVLHWFERNAQDGSTAVTRATLDGSGSFGEWPEDFGDTELMAEKEYLDSVAAKQR